MLQRRIPYLKNLVGQVAPQALPDAYETIVIRFDNQHFSWHSKDPISDHQQSWGYEDGPWKGPGLPLLGAADLLIYESN